MYATLHQDNVKNVDPVSPVTDVKLPIRIGQHNKENHKPGRTKKQHSRGPMENISRAMLRCVGMSTEIHYSKDETGHSWNTPIITR